MDSLNLASGDNNKPLSPRSIEEEKTGKLNDENALKSDTIEYTVNKNDSMWKQEKITPETIDVNELKLKDRISQCRNIIESLKLELKEEKTKLQKESITYQREATPTHVASSGYKDISTNDSDPSILGVCVDTKLNCDENLIEYEKQLQKYQNTLNMAQLEKKNAIRKQMLAKAYRLKLLEVENQCNIELLRVKQSLQCLEPLQMIASKWKNNVEEDLDNFDLLPRYPELNAGMSGNETSCFKNDEDINVP